MARSVEEVQAALDAFLALEGPPLGLGDGPFALDYVPNPGGFVNANFTVRSRGVRWHVKLASPTSRFELRRWWELREPLTERYRAPRMHAWIELEGGELGGAIVEHVGDRRASFGADRTLWSAVHACARELNHDGELAAALATGGPVATCADYLDSTWLDMLEADVRETRAHEEKPTFVDAAFWDWAVEEVERTRRLASGSTAFSEPAGAPVHGDLWEGNVLVGDGRWWIVDWDDIALGDPAKDITDWWSTADAEAPRAEGALAARLPLWRRVRLLVDAVDPLADWAEAVAAPEDIRGRMRDASRTVHETALAAYRERYG